MKRKNHLLQCSITMLSLLFAVGCSNHETTNTATEKETTTTTTNQTTEAVKTIQITNSETEVFINKTLQINIVTTPENQEVEYSVDQEEFGTISETGLFTAKKKGHVKVTATIKNTEVKAEYEFDVIDTIIDDTIATDAFDYEGIYSKENVSFQTKEELGNNINAITSLKDVKGTVYDFKAKVSLSDPKGDDTWSRVSLGHKKADGTFHGFFVSPGINSSQKKTVVMDIQDGNVLWGETTDRSQVWNQHDLASLDMSDMTLETIRNGDQYYYFINDELYWYEDLYQAGEETIPSFCIGQTKASFSHIEYELNTEKIQQKIDACSSSIFYPSFKNCVTIDKDGKSATIKGVDTQNAKDVALKSIGDRFIMPANKESSVTFSFKIDAYGSNNPMPALAFTINRHEGTIAESRSYVISETKAGFTGWNANGNLVEGIGDGGKEYLDQDSLEIGKTYLVTCTRLMTDNGQDTKIKIAKEDGTILLEYNHGWQDGYKGNAICSFLIRDLDCTISNIELHA